MVVAMVASGFSIKSESLSYELEFAKEWVMRPTDTDSSDYRSN